MKVGVDIDDTLYSFSALARNVFVELALERGDKRMQRGAYCFWGEWRTPIDVTNDEVWIEVINRCHSDENILSQEPYPDAVSTLCELRDYGYELIYISGRKEDTAPATNAWLFENEFPPGNLICTMADKMPHVSECQYIIDDRPKTLCDFVYDFNWKSMNRPWPRKGFGLFGDHNRAITDIPNIYLAPNWKLLRQYMIDKGVFDGRSSATTSISSR